jgi:hypothetical protein
MMPLLDYYGEFAASNVSCNQCGWTGQGREMTSGETFGDGIDKDCPACGERWGFVQWSVIAPDEPTEDWQSRIGRVEF